MFEVTLKHSTKDKAIIDIAICKDRIQCLNTMIRWARNNLYTCKSKTVVETRRII